jgi:hypothetical protein
MTIWDAQLSCYNTLHYPYIYIYIEDYLGLVYKYTYIYIFPIVTYCFLYPIVYNLSHAHNVHTGPQKRTKTPILHGTDIARYYYDMEMLSEIEKEVTDVPLVGNGPGKLYRQRDSHW